LHEKGSSNPLGLETDRDKVIFSPLFFLKDLISLLFSSFLLILVINICPNVLGDVENFNISSTVVTPPHIQPE
jgi:quinol-cytochrome oxidoreductase complex cytochrome b subunit